MDTSLLNAPSGTTTLANEPSLILPWEYDYVGQPWKTQQVVRRAQDQLWSNSPTGWGVSNDDLAR